MSPLRLGDPALKLHPFIADSTREGERTTKTERRKEKRGGDRMVIDARKLHISPSHLLNERTIVKSIVSRHLGNI